MDSDFINFLKERGFIYQCTNEKSLSTQFSADMVVAYIGFDCTAASLHVGSLVQIMFLRWLQKFGHKPIILLGGATTKVGDPSGKDKSRALLSEEEIIKNKLSIESVFSKFLYFGNEKNSAVIVNNDQWLSSIGYLDFLRDVGRHVSINRMLEFDSVKTRLEREQHLSFLEFNYMLLQAYDFVELKKQYGCILQVGGSDQWGNIVSGIELGAKMLSVELYGITTPLVVTKDGKKMGKTLNGAIWLDELMCSPYEYWQYFRNVADEDLFRFLYLFTELSKSEIEQFSDLSGKELNEVKKTLATKATTICHGKTAAEEALQASVSEFENNDPKYLPSMQISEQALFKALVETNFANSNADAKRKVASGGVMVNDIVIRDINFLLSSSDKISIGKKKIVVQF